MQPIPLTPMTPIKVKNCQINLATYATFNLLSNNASMKAKKLEELFKESVIVAIYFSYQHFFHFFILTPYDIF